MEKSNLKPGHLRRVKSLALLDDIQLKSFLTFIEVVNLAQAAILFREGQAGDSMFLILEGQMRVFTRKNKSEETIFLRLLEAGDAFGEISLLTEAPRSASVEATQTSVLIKISAAALGTLTAEEPALAAQLLYSIARTLGRQLSDLTGKLRMRSEQFDLLSQYH